MHTIHKYDWFKFLHRKIALLLLFIANLFNGLSIWWQNRNFPLELSVVWLLLALLIAFFSRFIIACRSFCAFNSVIAVISRHIYNIQNSKLARKSHASADEFLSFSLMCCSFSDFVCCRLWFYYAIRIRLLAKVRACVSVCVCVCAITSHLGSASWGDKRSRALIFRTWYGCNMLFNLKCSPARAFIFREYNAKPNAFCFCCASETLTMNYETYCYKNATKNRRWMFFGGRNNRPKKKPFEKWEKWMRVHATHAD